MSYAIYIGKNHSATGHAWLGGYGDEPSSHWLEIIPAADHGPGTMIEVGVGPEADMPGRRTQIPQVKRTLRHMRVSYSYYLGVPAPITNGGLNAAGVAVRDVWSTSRAELIAMTPKDQTGLNYSDLARIVMERATSAREAVEICAALIADHGEATYGGNSHLFADADEAWVMIQFAGGKGLWVAERLGPDSIRASRPGYVLEVPVNEPDPPDFLWSPNFVSFAREMGWYDDGAFNANTIYGDSKGRWEGVRWIEAEMQARAARPEKIDLADVIWAVRTEKLTGDTAGYGQVVPLLSPSDPALYMMWHAATGAIAAPFAPVFLGQSTIPPEYGPHRYLTTGESHRFMDLRKAVSGNTDTVSLVSQAHEAHRSAVQEAKRLMYLMQLLGPEALGRATGVFEAHEARLARQTAAHLRIADAAVAAGLTDDMMEILGAFSTGALLAGLRAVAGLSAGFEVELSARDLTWSPGTPVAFPQIW
ncbi:C69 family dipeptidase [Defluviimonas sp. WL0050]|uniref:Dipeptidase n=1 Tax=Albidovulum litorale TaxID=2984134 RepID=A0ABT2ZNL9_9RHOB|nr:C69 family dipeptidase [Defluviimonas sp. WL0050]MCV2872693.1 C69 family dipeptidase [Defluviimonas sp. WL0050]